MVKLASIEGNIGVGKSTFTKLLEQCFSLTVVPEPINVWLNLTDESGDNILQKFYNDKNRWSYTFQNIA